MSGFPKLIPAFTVQIALDKPSPVGAVSKGPNLVHVGFIPNSGSLRSEPDYPVKIDAVFTHGADYIKADPDGEHARLEVQSILKDKSTGALVRYNYTGIIDLRGAAGKVLRGEQDAKTSDFGDAFAHVSLETGSAELKRLENRVYVASGRFVLDPGQPVIVEYKVSEVAK
ncbi:hypothetical protein QBC33DRAFT_529735 [Phialemonium atrogriseum]|uniref:Uncharacterized protein n=1 Tax=Phialemonium atrogriseum TaxID=1093897 RepID=A0AAJ0FP74_9PEZI|nr:uncharacterized protein QBC33DRAFT_529735 [Phialemonium atrogriseum]KAK1769963.1 hypothetical protein QBC33DRAFT_529735 [Phialemonium atrogriseum]